MNNSIKNYNLMKTKQKYERPLMHVVELQYRTMILAGSGEGGLGSPDRFNPGGDPLDDE